MSVICHALTNLCRGEHRDPRDLQTRDLKTKLVNKGFSITRPDGYDDIAWLPVSCPILTDYMHEPVLVAMALLTTGSKRIATHFKEERIGNPHGELYWVQKLLVMAYQGHDIGKANYTFGDDKGFWRKLSTEEAESLVIIHGSSKENAYKIMRPLGAMVPKRTRGYLHFSACKSTNTLDQMDQLVKGSAYIIPNMRYVAQDYDVYINDVQTVTLKKKGTELFERRLARGYIRYALDRNGNNLQFPASMNLDGWSRYLGEHPPPALKRFFTEDNYTARTVLMDSELQAGATLIHASERAALAAININARRTEALNPVTPLVEVLSVKERAASGHEWSLTRREMAVKELLPSSQIVTFDYLNPTSVNKSLELINMVKNLLNQERAPTEGTEKNFIRYINFTNGHRFRIGQIREPAVQRDLPP